MEIFFKFYHSISHTFREFFVYHYSSLTFRANIFALVIAADENPKLENFITLKEIAMEIYNEDEKRANALLITTKEIVNDIQKNKMSMDTLIDKIQQELHNTPRYANKIDSKTLLQFIPLADDEDTKLYRQNIIEFLEKCKNETLEKRKKK
ncbi:hypothetical protein MNB_SM-3-140 [hydrothermal vent metagenome]|uniref:Uncharacterized protein n=1 Tax=hydrothermal vent metagenome TaxID=652676 RepID=A0A1W1D3N2_9ZZZZ